MSSMERRREPRFHVHECYLTCSKSSLLSFLKDPSSNAMPVVNLSATGLEFLSKTALKTGQKLDLFVDVPAFDEPLELAGTVRWVRPGEEETLLRIGFQFTKISREAKANLQRLKKDGLLRTAQRTRETTS